MGALGGVKAVDTLSILPSPPPPAMSSLSHSFPCDPGNPQGLENAVLLGPVRFPFHFQPCFWCVPPRPPCHTLLTILLYIKGCLELLLGCTLVTGFDAPGPKTEAQKVRRNGD